MTGAEDASVWTEHQHGDGRRYFYNRITKQSSWDKPDCLKTAEEQRNTTTWKEYKTSTGRDYYFNTVTQQSVWEMPLELKRIRGLVKDDESDDEEEKQNEDEKSEEPEYATQEDRRNAFRELLEEKSVKPTMKWEEALKLIADDRRLNALTTAGERKQVFAEYVTQTKKRQIEEQRERRKRAKDDFIEELKNWDGLKLVTRYREVAEEFMDRDWFKLIEEEERDELFQDFMDENEKKVKDDRRKKRKEVVEKVKEIYDENKDITTLSRWRDVQELLRDCETFRWLTKLEALTSWEEWVTEAEKKEVESKAKTKFRQERLARDAFREALMELRRKNEIKMSTQWRDVANMVKDDPRYIAMIGQSGSTPHDHFEDLLEELGEKYKEDRAKIKKLAKEKGIVITSSSAYEWFHDQLKMEEAFLNIEEENRKMMFDSLVAKAREQDEDAEKAAKRNRKKFVELLQRTREVTAMTSYDAATKILGTNPAWDAVDEMTRRQCFDIFVDQLKIQCGAWNKSRKNEGAGGDDAEEPAESDDGGDQRQKKDKKKEKSGKKRKQLEEPEEDEPPTRKVAGKQRKGRDREEDYEEEEEPEKKKHKKHKR
eukprot:TRINITY_DN48292_c0_g1_i1.p1 TRINITY_DN48292_c0_g1~~TRINITY_DN48292_c0_g1_i1.p1  ORF type:complete len:641 (-),score=193.53 TRINITY_DN48292_c0_g1_i1:95-1888(-)